MSESFWRTASEGEAHCVVVGSQRWVTSSYSASNGQCVQAQLGQCDDKGCVQCTVKIRDSKDINGPVLTFTPGEWSAFTKGVKDGMFDLPSW
jgi:hypothetical protein